MPKSALIFIPTSPSHLFFPVNPLLRSLDSIITRIEKKPESTPSKGAKSKKKTTGELEWEIEFKDTGASFLTESLQNFNRSSHIP